MKTTDIIKKISGVPDDLQAQLDSKAKAEHIHDTRYAKKVHSHNEYYSRGECYNIIETDNLLYDLEQKMKVYVDSKVK